MIAALLEESSEAKIASQLSSCRVAVEKVGNFDLNSISPANNVIQLFIPD